MASIFVHLKTKEQPRFHHRKWHPRQSNLTLRCNTNKVLQMGMSWYVGTSSKVVILNCFGHKIIILFSNKSMDGFLGGQFKNLNSTPQKKTYKKQNTAHSKKNSSFHKKKRLFFSSSNSASSRCCSSSNFSRRSTNFCLRKRTATDGTTVGKKYRNLAGDFWKYWFCIQFSWKKWFDS